MDIKTIKDEFSEYSKNCITSVLVKRPGMRCLIRVRMEDIIPSNKSYNTCVVETNIPEKYNGVIFECCSCNFDITVIRKGSKFIITFEQPKFEPFYLSIICTPYIDELKLAEVALRSKPRYKELYGNETLLNESLARLIDLDKDDDKNNKKKKDLDQVVVNKLPVYDVRCMEINLELLISIISPDRKIPLNRPIGIGIPSDMINSNMNIFALDDNNGNTHEFTNIDCNIMTKNTFNPVKQGINTFYVRYFYTRYIKEVVS